MSYILDYCKDIEKNPSRYGGYIKKIYSILEPIAKGEDKDYYLDEKPAKSFCKMCSGSIESPAQFRKLLELYKGNNDVERFHDWISHGGHDYGLIRQASGDTSGLPLILLPFQKALIEAKYGIKRRKDGRRRFTEMFAVMGRKNGKTALEAAFAVFSMIIGNSEEIYIAASTYAQAKRLWEEVRHMIEASPELNAIFTSREFPLAKITFRKGVSESHSEIVALSSNSQNQDGFNVSHAIIDEVHNLPREEYDILEQGTSSRSQPMVDMISTAGFVRKGLYDDKFEESMKVLNRDKYAPEGLLPILYMLDDGDDWEHDPKVWIKANPALGEIKKEDYIRNQVVVAGIDPNCRMTVKTKDFNIVCADNGQWLERSTIIQPELYTEKSIDSLFDYGAGHKYSNMPCIGSFDLSSRNDMTAMSTMMFDRDKGVAVVKTMYIVTTSFLESDDAKRSKVPWKAWIDRGLVMVSRKGTEIDLKQVSEYFYGEFRKHGYYYRMIAYDNWGAKFVVDDLNALGFHSLVRVRQNYEGLSIAVQKLYSMLKAKELNYLGNPVTEWCLSNMKILTDHAGNFMIDKKNNSAKNKIDGAASILDCLAVLCDNINIFMPSLYMGGKTAEPEDK
jgi:phage terminase large subunit-like protein